MAAILILIIFSSWAPRVSSVDCNGYYGYDTNFECKWMEAVDLLVPAAWIAAVGIFLLALTVSKDVWIMVHTHPEGSVRAKKST